jgi:DNA gyrase subunit A
MKFEGEDADDRLIAVAVCGDSHDVLLSTHNGRSIRFPVDHVRVFTGRSSVGVRGIRLLADDRVISMSVLRHEEIDPEIRDAYLSMAAKRRKAMGEESEAAGEEEPSAEAEAESELAGESTPSSEVALSDEKFAELAEREEFLLSITEKGFGARSSAYDYRITGRGGQGLNNMTLAKRDDHVVAVFPVTHKDQIMLVTDGGTVIRCPVFDIRMARRPSQGVVVFKVGDGEHVVSVARLGEMGDENGGAGDAGNGDSEDGESNDGGGNGSTPDDAPPAEKG